jgi:hypothetical protein
MKNVFGRNPMFLGTRKDYYFHYSAAESTHCFVSMRSAAIETDVCRNYSYGQKCVLLSKTALRAALTSQRFCRPTFCRTCEKF